MVIGQSFLIEVTVYFYSNAFYTFLHISHACINDLFVIGVEDEVRGEGTHFIIPFLQTPIFYDVRSRFRNIAVTTPSKGGTMYYVVYNDVLISPSLLSRSFFFFFLNNNNSSYVLYLFIQICKRLQSRYVYCFAQKLSIFQKYIRSLSLSLCLSLSLSIYIYIYIYIFLLFRVIIICTIVYCN